jgi:hypothetical protein
MPLIETQQAHQLGQFSGWVFGLRLSDLGQPSPDRSKPQQLGKNGTAKMRLTRGAPPPAPRFAVAPVIYVARYVKYTHADTQQPSDLLTQ